MNSTRKIPVFVSCPTALTPEQKMKRKIIDDLLNEIQFEPRALGIGDYPKDYPLKEVFVISKHCAGGIILGFEQLYVEKGIRKRNTDISSIIDKPAIYPTPWNQLEAGVLFGMKLPLLIFRESGIEGGIFDIGTTEVFIHEMPPSKPGKERQVELRQIFYRWQSDVMAKYYEY